MIAMAEAALAQASGHLVPIGLSMGGYIALEMARIAPSRISAMVLFSTSCRQDNLAQRAYREQAIKMARQDGFRGVTRQFLGKCLSPTALADPALVDGVLAMAADIGRAVFAKQQKAILGRRDQRDVLAKFSAPLLIMCGTDDKLTPPHLSAEMAALAPHADMRLLPDVGHLSTLEAPDACRTAILDLLARV
jgi:pimeloyl-ACP methyl ester carboxylesterase